MLKDSIKFTGDVNIVKTKGNGIVEVYDYKNLVVNTGKEWIAHALANIGIVQSANAVYKVNKLNTMKISNSNISSLAPIDMIKLQGSPVYSAGLNAVEGSVVAGTPIPNYSTDKIATVTFIAKFTGVTMEVKEAGIFASSNDVGVGTANDIMLCRTTFNVINIEPEDSISITWIITIA